MSRSASRAAAAAISSATWRRARCASRRARPRTTTACRRRAHHLRRQCGRSDHRHDQGQRHVPQRGPAALARPVRQRRRDADDRSRRRSSCPPPPSRPGRRGRTSSSSRPDQTVELRAVTVDAHGGDEHASSRTGSSRARPWSPTASCGWSPAAGSASRPSSSRRQGGHHESLRPLHQTADHDDADHPRHHGVRRDVVPAAAGERPADHRLPHHPGAAPACRAPAPKRWRRPWRCRWRNSSRPLPASTRSTRRARRATRTSRCSSTLNRNIDAAAAGRAVDDRADGAAASAADAGAAVVSEGQSRRRSPVMLLALQSAHAAAHHRRRVRRIDRGAAHLDGAAAWRRCRSSARRNTPCASTSIRASCRRTASASTKWRPPSRRERQPADGHHVRRRQIFTILANGQLMRARGVRAADRRLPQRQPGAARRQWRTSTTASRTTSRRSWYKGERAIIAVHPEAAGHQRRRGRRRIKALLPTFREQLPPSITLDVRSDRSIADPRVGPGREADAAAHHRARRAGDLPLPAEPLRDAHSQPRAAGLDRRDVRGDVPAQLQPRQPVADGAHALASASSSTTRSSCWRTSSGTWRWARRRCRPRSTDRRKSPSRSCR